MRRILVPKLVTGELDLPAPQAHHLRDVLRLKPGEEIELFDPDGAVAKAQILASNSQTVRLRVDQVTPAPSAGGGLTIASAIPKGPRADWMIEKLSEVGADRFIPLITERSVVIPGSTSKHARWARLAEESARQSQRLGVMRIDPPTKLPQLLQTLRESAAATWYLCTRPESRSILDLTSDIPDSLTLLIGPEGGWSENEIDAFGSARIAGVRLTPTILRIETAAIAAASMARIALTRGHPPATIHPSTARNSS